MRIFGLLVAALVVLSGQTPTPKPARTLVYNFGYNTKATGAGQGTGTTTIEIMGRAADGGVMISGTDSWWNTVRPRATNTCELYPNGNVSCLAAPYAISPMQVTIFPLLAHTFFSNLSASGKGSWKASYQVKAAIIPGAATYAGQLYTWNCVFNVQGKGPLANTKHTVALTTEGMLSQAGGRYFKATSKQTIAYDTRWKVPLIVDDLRTYVPQHSIYSNTFVEMKLEKDSSYK